MSGLLALSCTERFEALFRGLPCRRVGRVVEDRSLRIRCGQTAWIDVDGDEMKRAFKERLADE